jgi:hypothetical protein
VGRAGSVPLDFFFIFFLEGVPLDFAFRDHAITTGKGIIFFDERGTNRSIAV